MSFTRFHYHEARTTKNLQQATGPARYIMNMPGVQEGKTPAFIDDPHWRMTHWGANLHTSHGTDGHPIDIDSDLTGLTRNLTRDSIRQNHYRTNRFQTRHVAKDAPHIDGLTDETRASHPAWMYRDIEQTRWYPLHLDPQENVCIPFHNNVSSRVYEKDEYLKRGKC